MHISINEVCHLLSSTFESFSRAHGQGVHAPVDVACQRSELRFDITIKPFLIKSDKPETEALLQFRFHHGDSHCRPWTWITPITVLDRRDVHGLLQQKIHEVAVSIKVHVLVIFRCHLTQLTARSQLLVLTLDPLHLFRSPSSLFLNIFFSIPVPLPPSHVFKVLLSVS